MAVSVKKVTLWRSEVENRPGMLARAVTPLAEVGATLQVVMAYRLPGETERAAIELYPVSGKRAQSAASAAGLSPSRISTLLVLGDDRPGLGSDVASAIAEAGINLSFLVTQVIGRRYSCVLGFESEQDAQKGAALIKRASRPRRK